MQDPKLKDSDSEDNEEPRKTEERQKEKKSVRTDGVCTYTIPVPLEQATF